MTVQTRLVYLFIVLLIILDFSFITGVGKYYRK